MVKVVNVVDCGIIAFDEALDLQKDLLHKRIFGETDDTLILLEHKPVITLGRLTDYSGITNLSFFAEKNIPILKTKRGGDITFHGPGQLVLYPIIDLKNYRRDVSFFITFLEKVVRDLFIDFGADAERSEDKRGVWIDGKKAAFIGISLRKWVTYHGVAININNELEIYNHFHACGDPSIDVCSLSQVLGKKIDISDVKKKLVEIFVKKLKTEYVIADSC